MADLTLSGASSPSGINGDYSPGGVYDGKTYYKHKSQNFWIWWKSDYALWSVSLSLGGWGGFDPQFSRSNANVLGAYHASYGSGSVIVSEAAPAASGALIIISE